jgi:hypothetical protein
MKFIDATGGSPMFKGFKQTCTRITLITFLATSVQWPSFVCAEDKLSLDDLGFSTSQTQGDEKLQINLHKRSAMLKTHQIMGLITAVPMVAALMMGEGAAEGGRSRRDMHAAMGMTAGALYLTTAYFAIMAPKGPSSRKTGLTRIHRALAFVHFPAMVLTGVWGYQAKRQKDRGEEVHGSAGHHQSAAGVAASAFLASMTIMVFNF